MQVDRLTPAWVAWSVLCAIFALAMLIRLHGLGFPYSRDYDEGVYWESLRALADGHALYAQVFHSQPPLFLLSVYPLYSVFGASLWSARFAVALISLLGLGGAALAGRAIAGQTGFVLLPLLLLLNLDYLAASQRLMADSVSLAFAFLAVGASFMCVSAQSQRRSVAFACLSGVSLALSVACKLSGAAAVVPVIAALVPRAFDARSAAPERALGRKSLTAAGIAFIAVSSVVLLAFGHVLTPMADQVISFHLASSIAYAAGQHQSINALLAVFKSFLGVAALYGTLRALAYRDWRVAPCFAWLVADFWVLLRTVPLFAHHLVILVPALVSLAFFGVVRYDRGSAISRISIAKFDRALGFAVLLIFSLRALRSEAAYLSANSDVHSEVWLSSAPALVADVKKNLHPRQELVTDAPSIAALAERDTPAWLVDTSEVRINSGYLTSKQVIDQAAKPQVGGVLLAHRWAWLSLPPMHAFDQWLNRHLKLKRVYAHGEQLWLKQ